MCTVIETLTEYEAFLKYDKRRKKSSMRTARLCLKYFVEIYGNTETTRLQADDMYAFYENIKCRVKKRKNSDWELTGFDDVHVYKIMVNIKAYTKRLMDKGYLTHLVPADVPLYKPPRKVPNFLTKEEMAQIIEYLEWNVKYTEAKGLSRYIDVAHMWRALVWFLYTTWLRNFELRQLKLTDVNIDWQYGNIIGKGNKLRSFTFNEITKEKLIEYLSTRAKLYPEKKNPYLFYSALNNNGTWLSEFWLNAILKKIGKRAWVQKNLHAHIFRHSLATHLLQDWQSIVAVRDKLGHENISTTSIYVHTDPKEQLQMTKNIWADFLSSM